MSKKYALNYHVVGKVALGPLSFRVDADMVLDPQPTEDEIKRLKIGGYLRTVDVEDDMVLELDSSQVEVSVTPPPAPAETDGSLAEFEAQPTSATNAAPLPDQKKGKGKK